MDDKCCISHFPGNPMIGQASMFDDSCPFGTPLDGGLDCVAGSKCRWCCTAPVDERCGDSAFVCPANEKIPSQAPTKPPSKATVAHKAVKSSSEPKLKRKPPPESRKPTHPSAVPKHEPGHPHPSAPTQSANTPPSPPSTPPGTPATQPPQSTQPRTPSPRKSHATAPNTPSTTGKPQENSNPLHAHRALSPKHPDANNGDDDDTDSSSNNPVLASLVVAIVILGSLTLALCITCCERHFRERRQCCCFSLQFSFRRSEPCFEGICCCKVCVILNKDNEAKAVSRNSTNGDPEACRSVTQAVSLGKDMVGFLLVDNASSPSMEGEGAQEAQDGSPGAFDPQFFS